MSVPETIYFQDGNVVITSTRAWVQGKTFAMANITSVSLYEQSPNQLPWAIAAMFGVAVVACGFDGINIRTVLGILIFLAAIGMSFTVKPQYIVKIGSASGEANGISSPDRGYIQKIVNAMNEAIVKRG